jgi:hypothetical protein
MPQAIELRKKTLMLISTKTEEPIADLQAMLENWQEFELSSDNPLVIVIDWDAPNGLYYPWVEMPKRIFDETFRFAFEPHNPNKFEPVVAI